jgi:hypothetical protein
VPSQAVERYHRQSTPRVQAPVGLRNHGTSGADHDDGERPSSSLNCLSGTVSLVSILQDMSFLTLHSLHRWNHHHQRQCGHLRLLFPRWLGWLLK